MFVVVLAGVMFVLPIAVAWSGSLARRERRRVRAAGRALGTFVLWLGFNVSFAAIWGAFVARRSPNPDIALWLWLALLALQPIAGFVSIRVVRGARREGRSS